MKDEIFSSLPLQAHCPYLTDHSPRSFILAITMPDPKPTTAAPRLKLVIRRLPPTIPEAIFWSTVSSWIDEGKSTWRKWYPGKKADEYVLPPLRTKCGGADVLDT